jgi:Aldehyde dehydrogenase family
VGERSQVPQCSGESERICPLFQRLPENGVCEFESSQPSQTVRYARRYFRACERHCGGVEAGLLMSQHRRHSTALSPVNVISSIEGDDHRARGRSRKEANCDRIRCVLGCSGPSIFALVDDACVAVVSATGSTAMGRAVGPRLAARFAHAILELGGNNAAIVAPSADLDLAVRAIAFAAMGTAGQRCRRVPIFT